VLKELIQNTIAKDSWEQAGGKGNIQYFPMGMALVINQPLPVQEDVKDLLESLRRLQDLQVAVEMRAVVVSESFFERIGVDFNMNIRTPTSRREPDLLAGNFVPFGFLNRTGDRLNNLISGLTPAGTLTPDLNVPIRNSTFNFTTPQFGGYQPEAGLSLGLAFLSEIQVFMFMEAVQGDRRAHIMQAPKVTVYNGQQASISATISRPVVTALTPLLAPSGQVVIQPQFLPIPFGMGMTVQPVVSPDRRFIRLNLVPGIGGAPTPQYDPTSSPVTAAPSAFQGFFNPGGTIPQPAFFNTPLDVSIQPAAVTLNIVQTTVNVPDGGTVLLGGFRFMAEERSEYGPPVLSNIPYLSRLFRNVGWSRDGGTLLYLVTARVIMVEEEEAIFLGTQPPIPGR
jgi:type II secretory pathway component GspD/PulD (secretin)